MKSTPGIGRYVFAAALAVAVFAGAAQAARPLDCSRINWYWLGERDGETNSNLLARYAAHCSSGQADVERYNEGRTRGLWVRSHDHFLYTP